MTYQDLEIDKNYRFTVGTSKIVYGPFKYLGYCKHSYNMLDFQRYGEKVYKLVMRNGEVSKVKSLLEPVKCNMVVSVIKDTINII